MILAPENLVVKQINGQKVKARDLVQYFKCYMQIYQGNELPEPKSMLVVSADLAIGKLYTLFCIFHFNRQLLRPITCQLWQTQKKFIQI